METISLYTPKSQRLPSRINIKKKITPKYHNKIPKISSKDKFCKVKHKLYSGEQR